MISYKLNTIVVSSQDEVYFDAVLKALQQDGFAQGRCLIQTTELGQLAMEYLDDRREEYALLESSVKRDMKIRLESLSVVQEQVHQMHTAMHMLIRRDVRTGCYLKVYVQIFSFRAM